MESQGIGKTIHFRQVTVLEDKNAVLNLSWKEPDSRSLA